MEAHILAHHSAKNFKYDTDSSSGMKRTTYDGYGKYTGAGKEVSGKFDID